MRIVHINGNYMTTDLHQNMMEYLKRDTDNIVFCPISNSCITTVIPNENVIVSRCYSEVSRLFYFRKQKIFRKKIIELCNLENVDIIHAYTLLSDGGVAMWLSRKINKPFVVAVRDTDINVFFRYKPYLIPFGIEIMERASAVFFLSDSYKDNMFEKFIPETKKEKILNKSYVIPNGIDDFWLNNAYLDRDLEKAKINILSKRIRLLCVGQIVKRKNIPAVQKAADILKKRGYDVHVDVVGNVKDEDEFNIIKSHSLTTYYEACSKEKLIEFYRNNDIFVIPSHTETFGLVYAEAMTQSMPVIYTKGQGFDGQFPEGTVGYHCDDTNPKDIAEAIIKVIENYVLISKNCVALANKFRWNAICDKYVEIYRRIV